MREHYLLDPSVAFLNHGSFGACPKPVFEAFQRWQLELEREPVTYFQRTARPKLDEVRGVVGKFLNADAEDIHFVRNVTFGINIAARSIALQPGDEILTSDHEYGATNNTWAYICKQTGANYIQRSIPLPLTTPEELVEGFWEGVTPKTRVIFLSHITSPTALIFPIEEICRRAREVGIITVIDGAHAPGQIPVDLRHIDADFYSGNFHKWLSAPKSAGFLYVRKEYQDNLQPTIVSHGYSQEGTPIEKIQWQGTEDYSAYLSVPDAIQFQEDYGWTAQRERCHVLAVETRQRIIDLFDLPAIAPERFFMQMFTAQIPDCDSAAIHEQLFQDFKVEVPLPQRGDKSYIRVSIQAYNTRDDLDRLVEALVQILCK